MKSLLITGFLLAASVYSVLCQSDSITEIAFTYDNAGNRTAREIIYFESQQKSAPHFTEIEDLDATKGIQVYPNPATHSLYLVVPSEVLEANNRRVVLFDNLGKPVVKMVPKNEVCQIDVSHLTESTYILKLTYGKNRKDWIIIKQ